MLAPTEVLASQHYRGLVDALGDLTDSLVCPDTYVRVVLLTGSQTAAQRRAAYREIEQGAEIIVGTHAALGEEVPYQDLGLVVVDEQHRFGVEQRDALRNRGDYPPHLLVMTATPIPRTVAMTVYGDLEVAQLRQAPDGRQPVDTHVVPAADHPAWIGRMWSRITEEVDKGHQAFIVCSRISDAEVEEEPAHSHGSTDETYSAVELYEELRGGVLRDIRIGLLHGQLDGSTKDAVMAAFAKGDLDVLVATTVIEVGVNVPNATVMVILDADRFGVSQLHQLRGRVGRGTHKGLCLLHTSTEDGHDSRRRLAAVASTRDGSELARLDLEIRGEGDVLGAAQSGDSSLKLLELDAHAAVIEAARRDALALVEDDPALRRHRRLAEYSARIIGSGGETYLQAT